MVSSPVIHVITWITADILIPEWWKAELAWLVDPVQTLPTRWSHVNHRSGIDLGKSASQRPMSWTLSYAANYLSWVYVWKTINTADWSYMWPYCCRPEFVLVGLGCGLSWTLALVCDTQHRWGGKCGLWHYTSFGPLHLHVLFKVGKVKDATVGHAHWYSCLGNSSSQVSRVCDAWPDLQFTFLCSDHHCPSTSTR